MRWKTKNTKVQNGMRDTMKDNNATVSGWNGLDLSEYNHACSFLQQEHSCTNHSVRHARVHLVLTNMLTNHRDCSCKRNTVVLLCFSLCDRKVARHNRTRHVKLVGGWSCRYAITVLFPLNWSYVLEKQDDSSTQIKISFTIPKQELRPVINC